MILVSLGAFKFGRPLVDAQKNYLLRFNETRRMRRDPAKAALLPDPWREVVGLPVGPAGAYFVGGGGFAGQDRDASVVDFNQEPDGQPGLWCQWTVDPTGNYLGWDGGEKFYDYQAWLRYLIDHFFNPWEVGLTGVVRWRGESPGDKGSIVVANNKVDVRAGEKVRLTHGTVFKNTTVLGWRNRPARA
jgi:hypothetical protein